MIKKITILFIGILLVTTVFAVSLSSRDDALDEKEQRDIEREAEILANMVEYKDLNITTGKICELLTMNNTICYINYIFKDDVFQEEHRAYLLEGTDRATDEERILKQANEIIASRIPYEEVVYEERSVTR